MRLLSRGADSPALFTLLRITNVLLSTATVFAVAGFIGGAEYGRYAAAQIIVGLVLGLGAFGVDQLYLAGRVGRDQATRALPVVAALPGVTTLGCSLAWVNGGSETRIVLALLGFSIGLDTLRIMWLLDPQRAGDFRLRALRELLARAATSVTVVVAAAITRDATSVALAQLACSGILALHAHRVVQIALKPVGRTANEQWIRSTCAL
jgi:O-antigen/teichoic acid export membrane protein